MIKLRILFSLYFLSELIVAAFGDAGVVIPSSDSNKPDPKKLSLADMQVSILVDNQNARVNVRQIFASHVGNVLGGQYLFALNPDALISDFAVWDGLVRIPGVILERKRAEEIYNALRLQAIDPGLLQQAEQGEEGGSRVSFFSAKLTPIPGFGTKRLELEYAERLPVEQLQSYFYFPLKPRQFQNQTADHLRVDLTIRHATSLANFRQTNVVFPLQVDRQTPSEIQAHFEGTGVKFTDDFAFTYELKSSGNLSVLFYRSKDDRFTKSGLPITAFQRPAAAGKDDEPGYFQANALFNLGQESLTRHMPSLFILLFDASLSIRWDKLERQFEALEKILYQFGPEDRFQLLLFNSKVFSFQASPVQGTKENVLAALEFVKKSRLAGGTDLKQALEAALDQALTQPGISTRAVLLSDGNATLGTLSSKKIVNWFSSANRTSESERKLKLYAYGIGNDSNKILLSELAGSSGGIFEVVGETEATEFKLNNFVSHLTLDPLSNLDLKISQPENLFQIYRSPEGPVFQKGMASWVGQYRKPGKSVSFSVTASQRGNPVELKQTIDLPSEAAEHLFIPRNWAKARVGFLLRKIELEGEDTDSINEIIRLSKKYKFVTPYTSFLAAPRSLLRPRLIKPGDPVLRVRTDRGITRILAIFPFGLTKPLKYLTSEDAWQTRFLAPKEMVDGTYYCRLILRDSQGRVYEEKKSFVIDSRAPALQAAVDRATYHPGDTVQVKVRSDADTRRIRLRLSNLEPVEARWSEDNQVNLGYIVLPAEIATGQYTIEIFAEDFAHNSSSGRVQILVAR